MPLNRDGTVDFSGTLFGLIRTALSIKRPEGMRSVFFIGPSGTND